MTVHERIKSLIPSRLVIAIICSVVLILILLGQVYKQKDRADTNEQLVKALTDTITVYKTKDGKNAAYIRTIRVASRAQAIELAKFRSANVALQLQRNKNITTITEYSSTTRIDTVVKVNTISVLQDTQVVFNRSIKNNYYSVDVSMKEDSLSLGIEVYNKQTIAHIEKPGGLFKEDVYTVEVINDNPYTVTTGLTSYEIKPKKKNRFLKGVAVGAAAVLGGIILLK